MAARAFWAGFYSSRRPSQIGPTADFDGAAIPPTIFSMFGWNQKITKILTFVQCSAKLKQFISDK